MLYPFGHIYMHSLIYIICELWDFFSRMNLFSSHIAWTNWHERFQWYIADKYLGWSWSTVQNFCLIAQDSAERRPFLIKKHFFAQISKSTLVIPTKLGRHIARGKWHLVRELNLKRPWPWEMAAILRIWTCIFALFLDN